MVDEFQDTDEIQYGIIRRIYAPAKDGSASERSDQNNPVFLVGDPKQSIYRFRNADIYAYLNAGDDAERHHDLDLNWRSNPSLVRAVSTLFSVENPFLLPKIKLPSVEPARNDTQCPALEKEGEKQIPMQVWNLGECGNKEKIKQHAAALCAATIRDLLDKTSGVSLHGRELKGSDIAVLTLTHDQGDAVRRELRRYGITSSTGSRGNVFTTTSADDLAIILTAIANPRHDSSVRAALATETFAVPVDQLIGMEDQLNDTLWRDFYSWHDAWHDEGFMPMFRSLMDEALTSRIAVKVDGERRLTDLWHIADLLQEAIADRSIPMRGMPELFARLREEYNDKHHLRLEGESEMVHILTVHVSKGLQFPIVFCPFHAESGQSRQHKDSPFIFHDADQEDKITLCLHPALDTGEVAVSQCADEELSEKLRLLYVALTRAENACYLFYSAPKKNADRTVFGYLFPHGLEHLNDDTNLVMEDRYDLPEGGKRLSSPDSPTDFHARTFSGKLPAGKQATSFSGLTRIGTRERWDDEVIANRRDDETETRPVVSEPESPGQSIYTFPRGGHAGNFWHSLLEQIDFTDADPKKMEPLLRSRLAEYDFHPSWVHVVSQHIQILLRTPLSTPTATKPAFSLSDIGNEQRLNELEFWYPLRGFSVHALKERLQKYMSEARVVALDRLGHAHIEGYMRGFIDLIFVHEGRYYLADYKSNWLGHVSTDYAPPKLEEAIVEHCYHLQYLIYSVALHRYLQHRLPGYRYEEHFGGVYYLFLRGMGADSSTGVFYDKPPPALMQEMNDYIGLSVPSVGALSDV